MIAMNSETQVDVSCCETPVRREDLTVHELDDEALIFDADSSDTHRLNTTACFIWRLCDGVHEVENITSEMTEAYDVSPEEAVQHVRRMLAEFREHRLLRVVPHGFSLGEHDSVY